MQKVIQLLVLALSAFEVFAEDPECIEQDVVDRFSRTNLLQIQQRSEVNTVRVSHYSKLTGSSPAEIAAKINQYIATHPSVRQIIPCEDLDSKEVAALMFKLLPFVAESAHLSFPDDDGRQLSMKPWVNDAQYGSQAGRDAQCAETLKLWAHHIPGQAKVASMGVVLPSLPEFSATLSATLVKGGLDNYNKSMSCVAGHNVVDVGELGWSDNGEPDALDWPHWPSTVHFHAKGHGPYPFWHFGPPQSEWEVNLSFATPNLYNSGVDMEVWHSTPLQATKFYHSQCKWAWLGFEELENQACVGLQLNAFGPNGTWYLYTADPTLKASDEVFCCNSTWRNGNGMQLGTINRRFVDNMKYIGEANTSGDYYTGRVKQYVMALSLPGACPECGDEPSLPVNVFYETDMEGRPVRFGEYGQDLVLDGYLHDVDLPLMYEEMDPSSFTDPDMQNFPDYIFDVPKICKTNIHACNPGRFNRETSKTN